VSERREGDFRMEPGDLEETGDDGGGFIGRSDKYLSQTYFLLLQIENYE